MSCTGIRISSIGGASFSAPRVVGADRVSAVLWPRLSEEEYELLQSSTQVLKRTMSELEG